MDEVCWFFVWLLVLPTWICWFSSFSSLLSLLLWAIIFIGSIDFLFFFFSHSFSYYFYFIPSHRDCPVPPGCVLNSQIFLFFFLSVCSVTAWLFSLSSYLTTLPIAVVLCLATLFVWLSSWFCGNNECVHDADDTNALCLHPRVGYGFRHCFPYTWKRTSHVMFVFTTHQSTRLN